MLKPIPKLLNHIDEALDDDHVLETLDLSNCNIGEVELKGLGKEKEEEQRPTKENNIFSFLAFFVTLLVGPHSTPSSDCKVTHPPVCNPFLPLYHIIAQMQR
jgi:hypothetical protein